MRLADIDKWFEAFGFVHITTGSYFVLHCKAMMQDISIPVRELLEDSFMDEDDYCRAVVRDHTIWILVDLRKSRPLQGGKLFSAPCEIDLYELPQLDSDEIYQLYADLVAGGCELASAMDRDTFLDFMDREGHVCYSDDDYSDDDSA